MRIGKYKTAGKKAPIEKPRFTKSIYLEEGRLSQKAYAGDDTYTVEEICELPFFDIPSLASYMGKSVDSVLALDSLAVNTNYSTFYIDKETGRVAPFCKTLDLREINAPYAGLKEIQLVILGLIEKLPAHPCNHAFVQGKNIKTAAETMTEGDALIHADIKHFFDEHTWLYVFNKLSELCERNNIYLSKRLIEYICRVCTRDNVLPQGSPCSPMLTVVLNYDMDNRVDEVAKKYNLVYTRYADDMWFTGKLENTDIANFKIDLAAAVHPFRLNYKKFGVMRERAYPVFRGVSISVKEFIPSTQRIAIIKLVNDTMNHSNVKVSTVDKDILIEVANYPETPIEDIKTMVTTITDKIHSKYPSLDFRVKPKFFYVQSVKHCLGMNIVNGEIKYPRKKYLNMRLQAYLIGKQKAIDKLRTLLKRNHLSIDILTVFAGDDPMNKLSNNQRSYRNLAKKRLNYKIFSGRVNYMRQVEPAKADKIDLLVTHIYKYWLGKFKEFLDGIGNTDMTYGPIDIIIGSNIEREVAAQ